MNRSERERSINHSLRLSQVFPQPCECSITFMMMIGFEVFRRVRI